MGNKPELIVMLTHNDMTVKNAKEIFEEVKTSKANYFGLKEKPLPLDEMKELFSHMKECGKKTFLEVVEYDEKGCLEGAQIAVECKVDVLMGTMYFGSINELCKENNILYMPFVGDIEGRPSVLKGDINKMISDAKLYKEKGVYGIDLLGFRYEDKPEELIKQFVSEVDLPVCVAGGINSYERLDEIKAADPWSFTIGGAFFENKFHGSFLQEVNKVYDYIQKDEH